MEDWKDPLNCIPVLFVSGTHYETARLTGKTFASQIKTYCERQAAFFEKMVIFCDTETGKGYYDGFYEVGQRRCPQYMDEIRGLADGAGLPFQTIFLRNHMREFSNLMNNEDANDECEENMGCTDIVVSSGNKVLLGHSEDDGSASKDLDYVIVADIVESTNSEGKVYEAEKFVAHCTAGNLSGWCMAFNQHGLAYIENSLFPGICIKKKLGEVLHQRHLLAAKNVDDVLRIVEDKDIGSNSAFCLKFGFQGNSTVRSVEICPKSTGVPGNTIHITEIANTDDGGKHGYYLHTNHYIELDVPGQMCSDSSLYRLETVSNMKAPRTIEDICEILGLDRVHRQNEQSQSYVIACTLSTGIAVVQMGVPHVSRAAIVEFSVKMEDWKDPLNCIPVLFVSGTHYEAANLTGRTFASQIKTYCERQAAFFEKMITFCDTDIGKECYDGLYEVGQRRCPQYMDEIRGLADGAGLPFQTIFLRIHLREFSSLMSNEHAKDAREENIGCTDIVVSSGNKVLLGHSEDDGDAGKDLDYVIVADIVESTNSEGNVYEAEKFVAHCNVGNLPGWCMAFNQHGLAYIENSLVPGIFTKNKLGEVLHQRHLLAAKNIDDVLRIVEDKDIGSNSAFCLKFGFQGNSTVRSVEICPKPAGVPGNTIHIKEIANTDDGGKDGYYLHTNHYIELDVPGQILGDSSLYRLETVSNMKAPRIIADICEMLGVDRVHRQNEECMVPNVKACTLSTAVLDLVAGELLMYRKRPGRTEPPLLRLPFSILK